MKAISIFVCLTISNFLYQYITGNMDFEIALERSYFQGFAILLYFLNEN